MPAPLLRLTATRFIPALAATIVGGAALTAWRDLPEFNWLFLPARLLLIAAGFLLALAAMRADAARAARLRAPRAVAAGVAGALLTLLIASLLVQAPPVAVGVSADVAGGVVGALVAWRAARAALPGPRGAGA